MPDNRKRLEALDEMYQSERQYLKDMVLWDSEFRKRILNFPFFSLKTKYDICDAIFVNMYEIRDLHQKIFNLMKEKNMKVKVAMEKNVYNNIENGNNVENGDNSINNVYNRFESGKDMYNNSNIENVYTRDNKDDNNKDNIKDNINNDDEFCIDKTQYNNPEVLKLEYASIFENKKIFLDLYSKYVESLPKAEFELERLCHYSLEFKKGLQEFLVEHKIEYLGTRNFLYRPSTKLSRASLLLKAILKHETNPELRSKYEKTINNIKLTTEKIDQIFSIYSGQFRIYRLTQVLFYNENIKNQQSLALCQKNRVLMKEGEVIFKYDVISSPLLVKIYIFDNSVIFCKICHDQFSSQEILFNPIFASRILVFTENLGFYNYEQDLIDYTPLFILDTTDNKVRTIYFRDDDTRLLYYKIFKTIIYKSKRQLNRQIKLTKLNFNLNSEITGACFSNDPVDEEIFDMPKDIELSSSEEIEDIDISNIPSDEFIYETASNLFKKDEIKRAIEEYSLQNRNRINNFHRSRFRSFGIQNESSSSEIEFDDAEEIRIRRNWIQKICFGTEMFNRIMSYELKNENISNIDYLRHQYDTMIISSKDGIYKIVDNVQTKIYDGLVKKVLYDAKFELLLFLSKSSLCISKFNYKMNRIECNTIKNNIIDFYYGTNSKGSYIATKNKGKGKSSLVFLFSIKREKDLIFIDLYRKLYVGFKVYNIIFGIENMLIACNDFESVDMVTLRTEEFLEQYDPSTSMIFNLVPNSKARSVFNVNKKKFLVCYDSIGFYIDKKGRIINTKVIFTWASTPVYFKLWFDHLIIISKKWVDVYDIRNGFLVFTVQMKGMKFVNGVHEPIVHDEVNFYRLNI